MCSIVGIGFQKNHTFFNEALVRRIITRLLINGMSRGRTATGLCYTSNEKVVIVKNKLEAVDFTETEFYKEALEKYVTFKGALNSHLLSVIGHCRQRTKGTEMNNDNNHPIHYGDVVGVHNGIILNDNAQFEKYKKILPRKAQVDSEIIFALVDYFSKTLDSIPKGIQQTCSHLLGGYACAIVHSCQPHILWLFRTDNPCTIYHFKEKGILMFASLPSFITEAVSEYALGVHEEITLDPYEGIGINLFSNKYQRFDLTQHISKD